MPLEKYNLTCRSLVAGVSFALLSSNALAAVPDSLNEILEHDEYFGHDKFHARGYTLIHAEHHDGAKWEYWWKQPSHTCIQGKYKHDQYKRLQTTSPTDCNQYGKQAIESSDHSNAAAAAVGAVAVLGLAALLSRSHQRGDEHNNDSKSVAEFERGYRDGLHHERYHNYSDSRAYADGYNEGQQSRDDRTRYRSHDGHHSGYHPYVQVSDLRGARASSADSALEDRGFNDVGGYKQGHRSVVIWYNRDTRQCIRSVTKDGHINNIKSIEEGNCI